MWMILGLLVIGVGLFYGAGFILRLVDSAWLMEKMPSFFPMLHHKFPEKNSQLIQLGIWSVFLPVLGYYILQYSALALFLLLAFAVWEVYLGATFYLEINDIKGACVHMILHSFIAGLIVSHFLKGIW